MKLLATLFPYETKSKDGSILPKSVIITYLESEEYTERVLNNKLAFIGITHKDRKRDNKSLKIGKDDTILTNKNIVGRVTRLFIPEEPFEWEGYSNIDPMNFLWCEGEIFDPESFSGSVKDDILFIKSLLTQGVRPPISGVIEGLWDKSEVCRKILSQEGFDFTLAPSFKNANIKYIKIK